jgi:hypothetical protein
MGVSGLARPHLADRLYVPYHDPTKPFVCQWFASPEAANPNSFAATIK